MAKNNPQPEEGGLEIDMLDPRDEENEQRGEHLEELEDLVLEASKSDRILHINN